MHRITLSVSNNSTGTREWEVDLQDSRITSASIVERVVFCGKQNISLREHRCDDKILEALSRGEKTGSVTIDTTQHTHTHTHTYMLRANL